MKEVSTKVFEKITVLFFSYNATQSLPQCISPNLSMEKVDLPSIQRIESSYCIKQLKNHEEISDQTICFQLN
jgi:hypothetical protein